MKNCYLLDGKKFVGLLDTC